MIGVHTHGLKTESGFDDAYVIEKEAI